MNDNKPWPHIVEIDWATDANGYDIVGPVGPFESAAEADAWGLANVCNGEWNVAALSKPNRDRHVGGSS